MTSIEKIEHKLIVHPFMFGCSCTQIYDQQARDEGSGQPRRTTIDVFLKQALKRSRIIFSKIAEK